MLDFQLLSTYSKITYVFKYVSILIAVIGIPSNLITFIIFHRKRFNKYTFPFYMQVASLVDNVVLVHSFRHWAAYVFDANIDLVADYFCRLCEYVLLFVNASISVWLLALISLDRFLTIVCPHRYQFIKKKSFRATVVTGIALFSFALYSPVPIFSELFVEQTFSNETNTSELVKKCEMSEKGENLVYWINMGNLALTTFLINNILTVLLILFLFRS